MTPIREEFLKRREESDLSAGPEFLKLGLYGLGRDEGFELRGEDRHGRVHFRFRDPRRLVVMDEYDITLADLMRQYALVEPAGDSGKSS